MKITSALRESPFLKKSWFLLPVLLAGGCATVTSPVSEDTASPEAAVAPAQSPTPLPQLSPITIAAVGDIMLGTDYPEDRLPPDDGRQLLAAATPYLAQADIAFGNLEGSLLDGGEPFKQCQSSFCYLFRTPSRFADRFKEAGFDALSIANNHARDFGEEGRDATITNLERVAIRQSGRRDSIASWEVKDRTVSFIAFAPFAGANPMLDDAYVTAAIQQADANSDLVLVSFHGGGEGNEYSRIPFANEFYHGEDRGNVAHFAHLAVDAGADLVIGHGPHVPRALELYQGRLIAYSLGNFATHWGIKVSGPNGLAPLLLAKLDGDGRFLDGQIISLRQQRPIGPVLDASHEAARRIAALTQSDFPDTHLKIEKDGTIRILPASP